MYLNHLRHTRRFQKLYHYKTVEAGITTKPMWINGKGQLIKSFAGPTGAVLFKSLPDGAVLGAKGMIFRTDRQSFD